MNKPPGLLQTVPSPTAPSRDIFMDFTEELLENAGSTMIWVITNLFSKQAHFVVCQRILSAQSLARFFVQHMYRLHSVPKCMISDWGVQFASKFWHELLSLLGSSQVLSSAQHSQTNGACELTNVVLEQYLQ